MQQLTIYHLYTGMQYIVNLKSMQHLNISGCVMVTNNGFNHVTKLHAMEELHLAHLSQVTDQGSCLFFYSFPKTSKRHKKDGAECNLSLFRNTKKNGKKNLKIPKIVCYHPVAMLLSSVWRRKLYFRQGFVLIILRNI